MKKFILNWTNINLHYCYLLHDRMFSISTNSQYDSHRCYCYSSGNSTKTNINEYYLPDCLTTAYPSSIINECN